MQLQRRLLQLWDLAVAYDAGANLQHGCGTLLCGDSAVIHMQRAAPAWQWLGVQHQPAQEHAWQGRASLRACSGSLHSAHSPVLCSRRSIKLY